MDDSSWRYLGYEICERALRCIYIFTVYYLTGCCFNFHSHYIAEISWRRYFFPQFRGSFSSLADVEEKRR